MLAVTDVFALFAFSSPTTKGLLHNTKATRSASWTPLSRRFFAQGLLHNTKATRPYVSP